jgi:hypothetical protein
MTKKESLLISAYTGYQLTNDVNDLLEFISELLGRPILTHELASNDIWVEIRKKCAPMIKDLVTGITDK